MPKLILNGSPEGLDFPTPFGTKLYTVTLQLKFAEYILNGPHQSPLFSKSDIPNSADLAFIKDVVTVLREAGAVSMPQTEALNCLARALGYKHYASLQAAAKSYLETSDQRSEKLPGVFFWVYTQLCSTDVVADVELASRRLLEFFRACIYKPVFRYDFSKDSRFNAGVMTIYPTGILLDSSGGQENYHDVSDLSLLAVDYKVATASLVDLDEDSSERANKPPELREDLFSDESHRYIVWQSGSDQAIMGILALPQATQDDMFLVSCMNFPIERGSLIPEEKAQIILRHFPGKRLFCRLHSKHLNGVIGLDRIMLGFSQEGASAVLKTCVEPNSPQPFRYFSSQGLAKLDTDDGEREMGLWKMGLNAPGMFKAHKAQNPG